MNLELHKTKSGSYKLISRQTHKHPVLISIAQAAQASNKYSPVKLGVYNLNGGYLSNKVSVYSYISGKTERMNKRQFSKFMAGRKQIMQERIEKIEFVQEEPII